MQQHGWYSDHVTDAVITRALVRRSRAYPAPCGVHNIATPLDHVADVLVGAASTALRWQCKRPWHNAINRQTISVSDTVSSSAPPCVSNSLRDDVVSVDSLSSFSLLLKTFLFHQPFLDIVCWPVYVIMLWHSNGPRNNISWLWKFSWDDNMAVVLCDVSTFMHLQYSLFIDVVMSLW